MDKRRPKRKLNEISSYLNSGGCSSSHHKAVNDNMSKEHQHQHQHHLSEIQIGRPDEEDFREPDDSHKSQMANKKKQSLHLSEINHYKLNDSNLMMSKSVKSRKDDDYIF